MNASLFIKNQQHARPIDTAFLRRLTLELLERELRLENADVGIYIVSAPKMAQVNQTYLQHEGSTDVITFDYCDPVPRSPLPKLSIHGELFICIDDAIAQAKEFRTTWQSELIRYVIHGILHLCGYDDLKPAARKIMKQQENRLVKKLSAAFPPAKLAGKRISAAHRS